MKKNSNWVLFLYVLTALLPLVLLVACSDGGDGGGSKSNSQSYSYEIEVNGCKSEGKFSSKESYCAGLLDENQKCASMTYRLRQQAYQNECQ